MRKILIAGILVAVVPASIGLVTAVNGFSPGDETDESDNVCDVDGYGFGDGTCDGGGTGNCKGNCKQYGECNGICDGKCDGELIRNQYNRGNCWKNRNSNGCCKRD